MTFFPRHLGALSLLLCACGSSSTPAVAGGADGGGADGGGAAPKARAIVKATFTPAASCPTGPLFVLGDFGDPASGTPATPVADGDRGQGGFWVVVQCRVAPSAAGFELEGSASVGNDSFTVKATLDAQGKTSAGAVTQSHRAADSVSRWSATTCTLDPTARPEQGVAAGRYWASLACTGTSSDTGALCAFTGELRFENCAQQ